MSYAIKKWKQCVVILQREPDKPVCEIMNLLDLDYATCFDLVFDVVTIWNIHRREKFIRTNRQKEVYVNDFLNQKQK